jgi:glycine cleavage system protein P-like pyridoxal-binding family
MVENILSLPQQEEVVLEPLIYDLSVEGRTGANLAKLDVPEADLPAGLVRDELRLPEVSELQVVRHFVKLSQLNHAIDKGFLSAWLLHDEIQS